MIVDISDMDIFSKTVFYYLCDYFSAFNGCDKQTKKIAVSVLERCVCSGTTLLNDNLSRDILKLQEITKLVDHGQEHIIKHNHDINSPIICLHTFDIIRQDIKKFCADSLILEDLCATIPNLLMSVIFCNQIVQGSIISRDLENGTASFEKNYSFAQSLIDDLRSYQGLLDAFSTIKTWNESILSMFRLLLKYKFKSLYSRLVLLELVFSLNLIIESPFVAQREKKLIFNTFSIFQHVLVDCEIKDLFLEFAPIAQDISISARGSNHRTTRLQLIFMLKNQDYYSLRIDFPHKGQEYIHFNLEESHSDNAFPLFEQNHIRDLLTHLSLKEIELFFVRYKNVFWFKRNFPKLLCCSSLPHDKKEYLLNLYTERKHYAIDAFESDYLSALALFTNTYCQGIQTDFRCMPACNVDIKTVIQKNRAITYLTDMLLSELRAIVCNQNSDSTIIKQTILDIIYDDLNFYSFPRNDVEILNVTDFCDLFFDFLSHY